MAVVNVTTEAHERAKQMASEQATSISELVSRLILTPGCPLPEASAPTQPAFPDSLLAMALERSETPAETLEAALAALAAPRHAVPLKREEPLHEDGRPYCGCDGDTSYGPHHRGTCHRRTS